MAQRIRHLTTNQGIPGSNPGGVVLSLNILLLEVPIYFFQIHYILVPQTVCDLTHYALQFNYICQSERGKAGYNVVQTACDECMN